MKFKSLLIGLLIGSAALAVPLSSVNFSPFGKDFVNAINIEAARQKLGLSFLGSEITELTNDVVAGPGPGPVAATVVAIQGNAVSATPPNDTELLTWNATTTEWEPLPAPASGANVYLSNLVNPTSVNVSLFPHSANSTDLGSDGVYWREAYVGKYSGTTAGTSLQMNGTDGWLVDGAQIAVAFGTSHLLNSTDGTPLIDFTTPGALKFLTNAGTSGQCWTSTDTAGSGHWEACSGGGGSGTVTSVDASVPTYMTISGNPVTTTGTLAFDFDVQSGNKFLASPSNGSSGAMSMRAIAVADVPTLNQNTTGSAAKWTNARNLAGNSVDGSGNVNFANKFIAQGTSDAGLSAAQFLGSLGTGIVKNTTTTGVLSIAIASDFPTLDQDTTGNADTATAFDHTPTGCISGEFANSSDAGGNFGCGAVAYSGVTGTPTLYYQTIQSNTSDQTQRSKLNFSTDFSVSDSSSPSRTTVALASTIAANTTGSAAKWTTARNLAGNSVDGSGNVAFANKFIVQGTSDAGLSGAQFLGALGTGIVKNTTTTGVLSIAIAADFPTLNQNTSGNAATATALAADPSACGAGDFVEDIDADGTLHCATPTTGILSLDAVGSAPNGNGATISGTVLNLEPADDSNPGVISMSNQTMGSGDKTFAGSVLPSFAGRFLGDVGLEWYLTTSGINLSDGDITNAHFITAKYHGTGSGLTLASSFSGFVNTTSEDIRFYIAPKSGSGTQGYLQADIASQGTAGQALISNDTTGHIDFGTLGLIGGGTGSDLSATGGTSKVLRQSSSGAAVTVSQLACSDLSDSTSSCSTANATAATASTIVLRDGSGDFAAHVITGALTGNATTATTATNATNTAITNDTTTNATMYPTWVTANTGNLPQKVSSTKLSFNPSTGTLTSTAFSGPITGAVTGNADTATALAANPAACASDTYVTDTDANGTLTCTTVTNAGLAGSIAASKLVGSDIATVGTITSGVWSGTAILPAKGGTGLATIAAHGIMVGEGTSNVAPMAAGSAGQIVTSGGGSSDPVWTTATFPATATGTGKILRADGTNWAATTATFPNVATGTGTIMRADGTNWVASTATYPTTTTINRILYSSSGDVVGQITTGNSGVLVTDSGGVPSISSTIPSATQDNITRLGTIAVGVWNGTDIAVADGGTGVSTLTNHGVLLGQAASAIVATATGSAGQLLKSGGAAADPAWTTATFPSTATGTGTILRADGTNWVATTATYPTTTSVSRILYSSSADVVGQITTGNDGVLITSGTGVPSISSTIPNATQDNITRTGTVASGTWSSSFGDGEISALAGLTSANNKCFYWTGSGTASVYDCSATGRTYQNASASTGSGTTAVYATGPALTAVTTDTVAATSTYTTTQAISATSTDGFISANTTPATVGAQKWSPRLRFSGRGWKTDATAGSQATDAILELQPVQGAASPSFNLVASQSIAGGAYGVLFTVPSGGNFDINSGVYKVGGTQITCSSLSNAANSCSTTAATAATASTIVLRDGSGNASITTMTGAVTGTASGNTTYTASNHGVVISGSGNTMTVIAPDASTTKVLTSGGASADPTWTAAGTGTVTSVAMTVPAFLSIAGSPVTTTGTLAVTLSGTALPIANGGTASTTATGSGSVVLATAPAVTGITTDTVAATSTLKTTQAIAATSTDGVILTDVTAATVGAQKWSPRTRWTGSGWKTDATAAAQTVDYIAELVPVQGAAAPTANLTFSYQVNAGGYTNEQTFYSNGAIGSGDGTVSLPAYSFISDLDSGMYRIGANNIAWATAGTKALEIDSSQNVRVSSGAMVLGAESAAAQADGSYVYLKSPDGTARYTAGESAVDNTIYNTLYATDGSSTFKIRNSTPTSVWQVTDLGIQSFKAEVPGFTTTATAAGTTTLTISTATAIMVWTGSTTQTIKLPTTGVLQGAIYRFWNLSSGTITIQSSGANTITTALANITKQCLALVATPTTAANWSCL